MLKAIVLIAAAADLDAKAVVEDLLLQALVLALDLQAVLVDLVLEAVAKGLVWESCWLSSVRFVVAKLFLGKV